MSKLRIGFIGVGGIATGRHIPAFLELTNDVEIIGVSDVNEDRTKEVAPMFGIPRVYRHYKEMFSVVDAVVFCTPNKFHGNLFPKTLLGKDHCFLQYKY